MTLRAECAATRAAGRFTDDPLETFGGAGVVEIPGLQKLLRYICENGFEHHVAPTFLQRGAGGPRSHHALSRLGHVRAHGVEARKKRIGSRETPSAGPDQT